MRQLERERQHTHTMRQRKKNIYGIKKCKHVRELTRTLQITTDRRAKQSASRPMFKMIGQLNVRKNNRKGWMIEKERDLNEYYRD